MRVIKASALLVFLYAHFASAAWFAEPELPLQLSDFPNAERNEQQLTISYTGLSALPALPPGQALKVKIMIPPGLLRVVFSGSSNLFQAAPGKLVLYNAFPTNPSNFCLTSTPNCVSPSDLKGTAAGLGASIYNSETPNSSVQYGYLVIYNPPEAREPFSFSSVQIILATGDYNAYMQWKSGGTAPTTQRLTLINSSDTLLNNSIMGSISISGNANPNPCTASSCFYTLATNTSLTLTANANPNYRFVQWSGSGCQGQVNGTIIGIQMDRSKTCIAEYQRISDAGNNINFDVSLFSGGTVEITDTVGSTQCTPEQNCSRTYTQTTSIDLQAIPNANYIFSGWSGSDCPVPASEKDNKFVENILISQSASCVAQFTFVNTQIPDSGSSIPTINLKEQPIGIFSLLSTIDTTNVGMELIGRQDEIPTGEPKFLTKDDFAQLFYLETSLLTLNTLITPDPTHGSVDIILLAILDDNDPQTDAVWLEKISPQGSFDFNDTSVWKPVNVADLSTLQTYRKNWDAATPFSTSFGSGRVVAPDTLGNEGRSLIFAPAYRVGTDYVYSLFLMLLPDKITVLNKRYQLEMNDAIAVTANANSNASIFDCAVSNTAIATVARVPNNGVPACQVQGLAVGTTTLTVTTAAGETVTTEIQVLPTSLDRLLDASYEVSQGSSINVNGNADSTEAIFDCAIADESVATVSRIPDNGKTACRVEGVSIGETQLTVTTNASEETSATITVVAE